MNQLRMRIFITVTQVYRKLVVTGETESPIDIHKSVTIERVNHEDADHILAHQTVATAQENQKGVSVISDVTDVFVLLLHYYQPQNLSVQVVMESPIKERAVTRQIVQRNSISVPDLICCTCPIRMWYYNDISYDISMSILHQKRGKQT